MMRTWIIRSQRVVLPDGVRPATVIVNNGKIVAIGDHTQDSMTGASLIDAHSMVVMPGLVDTHVHVNEPGRTDWEGFDTATRAAAAGGVTTLIDMPLNSIPSTVDVAALRAKQEAARGRC